MSNNYSTKKYASAQYCDKQMSEIWCKNIQAFLRYSNFRAGMFHSASPCRTVPGSPKIILRGLSAGPSMGASNTVGVYKLQTKRFFVL